MFQLQVTIIRQTFQYMDMTWSVLTIWDIQYTEMLLVTETCSKLYIIEYIVVF